MPLVKCHVGYIYFSHIPKTGGTSIEDYLDERFGPISLLNRQWIRYWFDEKAYKNSSLRTSPQHLTASDAFRVLPETPTWSFAVVRDPVARIVSEFRFQRKLPRTQFRCLSQMGFSLWLETLLRAARLEPTIFDNHLRPQVDFITPSTEVFFFEHGLDQLIPRLNEITGSSYSETGIGWKQKSRETSNLKVTSSDARVIQNFYADDYQRFGYSLPELSSRSNRVNTTRAQLLSPLLAPFVIKLWRGNTGAATRLGCRLAGKARRAMPF